MWWQRGEPSCAVGQGDEPRTNSAAAGRGWNPRLQGDGGCQQADTVRFSPGPAGAPLRARGLRAITTIIDTASSPGRGARACRTRGGPAPSATLPLDPGP